MDISPLTWVNWRDAAKKNLFVLLIIVLAGAGLRFYGLDTQSFWNDELSSWRRSSYPTLAQTIQEGVLPDVHPPGYQALVYFLEQWVGETEVILRFPSAVAGALVVVVIYLIGRALYSEKEGLIAAGLTAVSWAPIYYSQEARAYSLLFLFSALSAYLWLGIMRGWQRGEKPSLGVRAVYAATAVITAYLHYFGLYFIVLQALWAALIFIKERRVWPGLLGLYALPLIAYLPWLSAVLNQAAQPERASWIPRPRVTAFSSFLKFAFNDIAVFGSLTLVALAWVGVYYLLNVNMRPKVWSARLLDPDAVLVLWLSVPFLGAYVLSITYTPLLVNRNLIIALPAVYLLWARWLVLVPFKPRCQKAVVILLLLFLLTHLIFVKQYYTTPQKEQFREATAFIAARENLYPNAIVIGYVWFPDYLNYYLERHGSTYRVTYIAGEESDWETVVTAVATGQPAALWYISAHKTPAPGFMAHLQQNMTTISHEQFLGAEVWLFAVD